MGIAPPQRPAEPAESPQKIVYIEKQPSVSIPKSGILGVILIVAALAISQILASGSRYDGVEILLLVMPLALCGILCITTKHPDFYCGWVAVVGYWTCFFILLPQWEEQIFLLIWGVVLVAAMVLRSIHAHRSGRLRISVWGWVLGTLLLTAAGILLLMNTVPPFWIVASTSTSG